MGTCFEAKVMRVEVDAEAFWGESNWLNLKKQRTYASLWNVARIGRPWTKISEAPPALCESSSLLCIVVWSVHRFVRFSLPLSPGTQHARSHGRRVTISILLLHTTGNRQSGTNWTERDNSQVCSEELFSTVTRLPCIISDRSTT